MHSPKKLTIPKNYPKQLEFAWFMKDSKDCKLPICMNFATFSYNTRFKSDGFQTDRVEPLNMI